MHSSLCTVGNGLCWAKSKSESRDESKHFTYAGIQRPLRRIARPCQKTPTGSRLGGVSSTFQASGQTLPAWLTESTLPPAKGAGFPASGSPQPGSSWLLSGRHIWLGLPHWVGSGAPGGGTGRAESQDDSRWACCTFLPVIRMPGPSCSLHQFPPRDFQTRMPLDLSHFHAGFSKC